ncbi:MAG: formylmethanofuran dehydrogenase subunit A [Gammaproteobacteria bacterium]
MLTRLTGGTIYDPANGVDGEVRDLYVRDGRIVDPPRDGETIAHEHELSGQVVMAGAIDIHTHIGGGKMTLARILLPEDHLDHPVPRTRSTRSGSGSIVPSTFATGYRYAEMGYTACFEPAMLPTNARQAHMEMADTPIVDKGAYVMLGSDDFLLRLMAEHAEQAIINDYVAWTLGSAQALAIKVVNPGGISAFKFNRRALDLDEAHPYYPNVSPRAVLEVLTRAVHELGVPHPLHVHGCNLGVPGNVETTLKTMDAAGGLPLHLTHVQFHSYGTEGDRGFSSGAARIAEAVNAHRNLSIDVGQIMFGQTVSASGDTMAQYRNRNSAHPKKWVCMDIECDAGCGIVPFRYKHKSFVNALQWAIGLELFLLVDDPWRVFLTTDHPNGATFATYPHLIRLLMDRGFRNERLTTIHPDAAAMSTLGSLDREYSLYEIAIMTRAAPARSLGLADRGHLGVGAAADITVYKAQRNRERMFDRPEYVFKDGRLVARKGKIVKVTSGTTHVVRPEYDRAIEGPLRDYMVRYQTVGIDNFPVGDEEIVQEGRGSLSIVPTERRA